MVSQKYKISSFKYILYILACSFVITNLYPGFCYALQLDKDSVKTYTINEVVITGTRYASPIEKIPSSITIIENREIRQSDNPSAISLLDGKVPGLFLDNRNVAGFGVGPNASGIISMRGIGGNPNSQILVLIDGQPQYMGIFGHPILDALNSSDVQRIEVLRGASSILYGSNALGGTINIITRKNTEDKIILNAFSDYGSFNTLNLNGSIGYGNKDFYGFVSFNNTSTDGHRQDSQDNFYNTSGFLKFGYNASKEIKISIDGSISNSKFYDPGPYFAVRTNNFYNYLRSRGTLSLENIFKNFQGALKLYYSYGNHSFFDGWNSNDEIKGIAFYENLKYFDNNIITVGVDYKDYGGKGSNPDIPLPASKGLGVFHSCNDAAVYGLLNYSPVDPFNMEAGVRITDNSIFGTNYTPQIGLTYAFSNSMIFKLSAGKAFQNPTIADLFLFPVANPELKPEQVWNYEVGVIKKLFNNDLELEATFFYDNGSNMIIVTPPFFIKNNSGNFIHKGLEMSGHYILNNDFEISVNYSFINSDKPVLYSPRHNLNIQIEYHTGNLQTSAVFKEVTGLYSDIKNSLVQNYSLTNLTINYNFTASLACFIKCDNLFSKRYEIDNGYPMPGRVILAGLKLNYY